MDESLTVDKLIEELQKIRSKHGGDLPIYYFDRAWGEALADRVAVRPPFKDEPLRVVID